MSDDPLIDAIWDYLNACTQQHGHQRTAERFGVSRQTLWRFLDCDRAGRRLPRAVLGSVGDSVEALMAATDSLSGESSPQGRPASPGSLRGGLRGALLGLCEAPLTTAAELAQLTRVPVSTLREQLAKLSECGLADSRPHRLAVLGSRPQRRWFSTPAGIKAIADDEDDERRLLRIYPISKQWFRLLAERLDVVAVLYHVAALIAEADPERQPVRVDHYRQGPYDALLTLSGGRSVGLLRQGPMLSAANMRFRLRTIERMDFRHCPWLTLVLTDSEQDTRRAVRALADPSLHDATVVACAADLLAAGPRTPVFQPGGYGFPNPPTIGPEIDLRSVLAWITRRVAAYSKSGPLEPRPDPDKLYRSGVRATLPRPAEQLDAALSLQLTRAEKQVLDLISDWPLSTAEQLAGLMGGVTPRRANQVLNQLRRRFLVRRDGKAHVLTDNGLTTLARRDRAAVGPTLDRWTPQQAEDGTYFGTALRAIASQRQHQAGITDFVSKLSAEVARSPDHEVLDLLPTQRSQISYRTGFRHFVLHPDASFQLSYQGDWDWCLLEYERRATTPKRVPERLRPYRRYFASGYARRDHGGGWPLVLFVFESAEDEQTFVDVAATLDHAPFVSTHTDVLTKQGVLGESWRLPSPHPPGRRSLHDFSDAISRPRQPSRALPVGASPPHPLLDNCPAKNFRSALGMPVPRDRVVRLLSSRTSLSGHLSAESAICCKAPTILWSSSPATCRASNQRHSVGCQHPLDIEPADSIVETLVLTRERHAGSNFGQAVVGQAILEQDVGEPLRFAMGAPGQPAAPRCPGTDRRSPFSGELVVLRRAGGQPGVLSDRG